ncbi:LexA family protein [Hyphomicrobium sp. 1Nfss2.1]|uniref:LexA family protein n=1 Tax=Hyphomicrobium sp. 1Nfss2.1 TaxID=3413936 RepID=UPI003C79F027
MELSREDIRAWLNQVLRKSGESATALARRAGIAQSTLTRFLNDDEAPMLKLRTITKIAHATGEQPIISVSGASGRPAQALEEGAKRYEAEEDSPITAAVSALIGDKKAADAWELGTGAGLELAGYFPGDILIVDLNETAQPGDLVCAQDYRWSEGKAETVFRFYDPPYLTTPSREEGLRKPLLVDNDRVVIKGVVIGSLRPRR